MLSLTELCEWLNITERHARKLVERDAIPYRKIGHLLRFAEQEIEQWSRPALRHSAPSVEHRHGHGHGHGSVPAKPRRSAGVPVLPKSLIEHEDRHVQKRAS